MARTDDSTAHAANWRTVLAVDAALGALVAVVGVIVALAVATTVGIVVIVAGSAYLTMVGSRARRWSRLRRREPGRSESGRSESGRSEPRRSEPRSGPR